MLVMIESHRVSVEVVVVVATLGFEGMGVLEFCREYFCAFRSRAQHMGFKYVLESNGWMLYC